jgi:outer membrane protein TolC
VRAVPLILILIATAGIQPTAAQSKAPLPIGTFLGGVPAGTVTSEAIPITILDAIGRALEHNLGVLTAEQALGRAIGAYWRALADLLPNVNAHVLESRQKINLQAFGFGFGAFGDAFAGVPTLVGPFNNFDARVSVSQRVLDLHALYDARAEAHNVTAAQLTFKSARDCVIHVAGTSYIQALAESARSDTAVTQRQTAETLYNQAVDLKAGGLVAGIDVLRAQVQLSTATQRATASANEFEKAKLQLARIIGLPLGQRFTLDARLPELPDADVANRPWITLTR